MKSEFIGYFLPRISPYGIFNPGPFIPNHAKLTFPSEQLFVVLACGCGKLAKSRIARFPTIFYPTFSNKRKRKKNSLSISGRKKKTKYKVTD
jgi:hypothetical protein